MKKMALLMSVLLSASFISAVQADSCSAKWNIKTKNCIVTKIRGSIATGDLYLEVNEPWGPTSYRGCKSQC